MSQEEEEKPLLPENIANMVTAISLVTRISLRCSSLFFDTIFEAAKYSTTLSLGISRNTLTNALSTAKSLHQRNDYLICSSSSKESDHNLFFKVLEKYTNIGLYIVSHTFSLAELFAMSGLQFTSRTIHSSLKAAEESVRILDGIFGSNDTSRAIGSFITLVHRELVQDPEFELAKAGKIAILAGLTKALTAFAVLQNVTHKRMMKQQIPMTILWEGFITSDCSKSQIIQFKNNKSFPKKDDKLIIKELNALLQEQREDQQQQYKITTKTTCITTKTTTICPLDSIYNKRIIVKTNQEENGSFLATLDNQQFIISTLSEKTKRRKIERQESLDLLFKEEKQQNHHKRRFSSPAESSFELKYSSSTRQRNASISSTSCIIHNKQRRSSCTSTFAMTATAAATTTTTYNNTATTYNNKNTPTTQDIVNNIAHFMRYASAAYGESFMRILGIGDIPTVLPSSHHHHPNHHAFAHHTGNSVEDILLSSYTDRSPLYLHNPSIHALVHYVTVDHVAKAIVLTCRGTLGLSDILTDLSMHYTEFSLPTNHSMVFKAHSGMLDAAQLLAKEKGKVYQKIRQGLEMYPDYGLVMCGHSLGGGVASLLCVLWSQEEHLHQYQHQALVLSSSDMMPSFVTSGQSGLPPGRPIHCYAYGPPGVMSLSLSNYCAGLVTSVIHGHDIICSLSLGLLQDFKNIATSLHAEQDIAEQIISRVVGRLQRKKKQDQDATEYNEDDQWFWSMIKTMRADMTSEKMFPPSTVYLIETIPQTKQHKVVLSKCEDVQARFSEIVFAKTMFMDHSPLMYERAIRNLCRGFTESSN